jgi:hypothetical protein
MVGSVWKYVSMPQQAYWVVKTTWIRGSNIALGLDRSGFEFQINHFTSYEHTNKVHNLCKPYLPPFMGINLDVESKLAECMAEVSNQYMLYFLYLRM